MYTSLSRSQHIHEMYMCAHLDIPQTPLQIAIHLVLWVGNSKPRDHISNATARRRA